MKRSLSILLMALTIAVPAFFISCERTLPGTKLKQTTGYVQGKTYRPAYYTTEDASSIMMVGDVTMVIPGEQQVYHPESY
jgi:hypothetical protein